MLISKSVLPHSIKIDVLYRLFSDCDLSPILDRLNAEEIIALHRFLWEKTVEFGLKVEGKKFSRSAISERMISASEFQQMKNCKEPVALCKGSQCFRTNPMCAIEKMKAQIDVLKRTICSYVGIAERN